MSVAFLLKPNYNTINNVHHDFYDVEADNIKNSSLNQALEVSTSVKAPVHVVGDTHTISSTAGGIITDAPQFEIPIVIASQVNTDSLLETTESAGITVFNTLNMGSNDISQAGHITCRANDTVLPIINLITRFPADDQYNRIDFTLHSDALAGSIGSTTAAPTATTWDACGLALITKSSTQIKSASIFAVTSPGSDSALVRNSAGAVSFDSTFDSVLPTFSYGTAGQIVQSNGSAAAPSWVDAPAPGDASAWSEYPATQDVDLVSQSLTSSTDLIKLNKDTTISKPLNTNFTVSSTDSTSANGGTVIYATAGSDATSYSQITMGCNSGKVDSKSAGGFLYTAGAGIIQTADARELILQTAGEISLATSNIRFAYSGSQKAYTINKNGALNFDADWNGTDPIIEGHFGVAGQVVTSQGDLLPPIWNSVEPTTWAGYPATTNVNMNGFEIGSATAIRCDTLNTDKIGPLNTLNIDAQDNLITNLQTESALNVFYVAKNGKNDSAASVTQPALTITNVISSYAASFYPQQIVIMVAPGVYSENIEILSPNVTIIGYAPSQAQNLLTQIAGSVTINCSYSQDLFYSQVGLYNIQVSGLVSDTSSAVHSVNIENCRMAANGRCFWQNSSVDNRTRLRNCSFLHSAAGAGTDPMICFSSGMAVLALLDATAKDNAPVLEFNGTAKLQLCGLCTFESTTTSATAAPIVKIAPSTGGAGYTYAFGYSSFGYTSLVPRVFSVGKNSGIVIDSGLNISLIITYNVFNLLLCDATCKVVSDVNKADPTKAATVRFFSNSSTYLATDIDATTKSTLAAVS